MIGIPKVSDFGSWFVSHKIFLENVIQLFGADKTETKTSGSIGRGDMGSFGNDRSQKAVGNHDDDLALLLLFL
jgi:hypothetical protein